MLLISPKNSQVSKEVDNLRQPLHHLQSSSVILEEDADVVSATTYTTFGEVRGEVGVSPIRYEPML